MLAKLCCCGTSAKDEMRLLLRDVVESTKLLMTAQRPRVISDLVLYDPSGFHTGLLEDCIAKDKVQGKSVVQQERNAQCALRRARAFISLIKQIVWGTSNAMVPFDLKFLWKLVSEIMALRTMGPDYSQEFINGLPSAEYNLFLTETKLELLSFATALIQRSGSSLYSVLGTILSTVRSAYSDNSYPLITSAYRKNPLVWTGLIGLVRTGLTVFGASFFDLATDVLFVLEPDVPRTLLGDFRELIERYDRSVVKKGEKYFSVPLIRHEPDKLGNGGARVEEAQQEEEDRGVRCTRKGRGRGWGDRGPRSRGPEMYDFESISNSGCSIHLEMQRLHKEGTPSNAGGTDGVGDGTVICAHIPAAATCASGTDAGGRLSAGQLSGDGEAAAGAGGQTAGVVIRELPRQGAGGGDRPQTAGEHLALYAFAAREL